MRGHNLCFNGIVVKIIPKLFQLPLLGWSSEFLSDKTSLNQIDADTLVNWLKSTLMNRVNKVRVCCSFLIL